MEEVVSVRLTQEDLALARSWAPVIALKGETDLRRGLEDALATLVKFRLDGSTDGISFKAGGRTCKGLFTDDGGMTVNLIPEKQPIREAR